MIRIEGLKKTYGKEVAIEDFNLEINEGESYGILGKVNSGGSTVLNILSNYIIRDEGMVLIDGNDPEDARDLIYQFPNFKFYPNFSFRKILEFTNKFHQNFDMAYAMELCESFKIDLDKKYNRSENIGICNIFSTIVTICMNHKYLLFDTPAIGISSFDVRKLSDLLIGNMKRKGYTPIVHCKNVNYFFDYIDNVVIMKDKKVVLCEKTETLRDMVYSISGPLDIVKTAIESKNVLGVKSFKNFSKLNTAYIMASSKEEMEEFSRREVSLKEIYEAVVESEGEIYE